MVSASAAPARVFGSMAQYDGDTLNTRPEEPHRSRTVGFAQKDRQRMVGPKHVSILALPESMATPIHGIYETVRMLDAVADGDGGAPRFEVDVVGLEPGPLHGACGLPLEVHKPLHAVERTDIVLMTSMFFGEEWVRGRHPELVEWLQAMHRGGADLSSACAGALLLAETGLLDGLEATTHWAFAPTFRKNFPKVHLRIEQLLITAGAQQELVMSGAASSWQDLILFLIARHLNPAAAQAVGRFLLYPWHEQTQSPYISFAPPTDHGDGMVRDVQRWIHQHHAVSTPVEEMTRRSGLPESSFKRRFRNATGYSPLQYVQHVRVERAKRRLEGDGEPIDEISWAVGYEDPAFFRRLFRRVTGMTPGQYRRKFRMPHDARKKQPA
jgi:transcriptional regulator GlxA family with amidase domain